MGLCHPKFGLLQNIKVIYFKTIALLTMRFEGAILADPKERPKRKKTITCFINVAIIIAMEWDCVIQSLAYCKINVIYFKTIALLTMRFEVAILDYS
jgi:hypothetical protein